MIRCSVAIMAHPRRAFFVAELVQRLDRDAEIVWDRFGDRHDTGRRAMLAYDPSATHHLVIQDDAVVCRDLVAGVEEAIPHIPPTAPMCLYVGRVKPFAGAVTRLVDSTSEHTSWLRMPEANWGVALVVPTAAIPEAMAWFATQRFENYDKRVGRFFRLVKQEPTWYTWPSLVDHRDSPTLVRGHGDRRHAHSFIGEDASAKGLDWRGEVLDLNMRRS